MVTKIGGPSGLVFELEWDETDARGTADEASRGRLIARIDDAPIWIDRSQEPPSGVSWSMIEILEHFAWAWPYLQHEESDPLGICDRPDHVRSAAEQRWIDISGMQRNKEQRQLRAFEDSHDLARAFQGMWLPSLWVLAQGSLCWLISGSAAVMVPKDALLKTLGELADAIVAHLAPLTDARARAAIDGWSKHEQLDPVKALEIATSLPGETLTDVAANDSLSDFFEWSTAGSELVALARMTGSLLAPAELRRLLVSVRKLPATPTPALDELKEQAGAELAACEEKTAYDQGCALARWVREKLAKVSDDDPVDPQAVLRSLGVTVRNTKLSNKALDAVAVWGGRHGPAILVNDDGRHAKGPGLRASLAHELCHVLVDRRAALPLGEVLGGRVQRHLEARARAFAAELLIPKSVAGPAFAASADPRRVLAKLLRHYKASQEIIAWQARNSDVPLPPKARTFLRPLVSMPDRF